MSLKTHIGRAALTASLWWNQFKYDAADVILGEDDGGTNYLQLALALTKAIAEVCDKCAAYVPVADAIFNAMPTSWWTDDPDHVEQWYTIQKSTTGQRFGASGNGWMKLSPLMVGEV